MSRPHVIVFGNEKGGSGKSTTAMHVAVGLLREGYRVAAIDVDARQASLTRYFDQRRKYIESQNLLLPELALPQLFNQAVLRSELPNKADAEAEETARFTDAMQAIGDRFENNCDFVIVDTPGSDNYLSRFAHSHADTLVTPLNDSFVDFALLANVDGTDNKIISPSIYAEMVWQQRQKRVMRDRGKIDWVVLRNRMNPLENRNMREMSDAVRLLAERIGFRVVPGFTERVIFRELYLKGLTVMDILEIGNTSPTMSHIAARQEVRSLLDALNLPARKARQTEPQANVQNAAPETEIAA